MTEMTDSPRRWMARALQLARRGEGRTAPNPPVGALLVRDGQLIGEGFHPRAGEPHAEIFALRQAGELARGADLYVTLEPCSHQGRTGPCCAAIIAAGVRRVFVGCADPNPQVNGRGLAWLRQAGLQVQCGILEAQARRLIAAFAKHQRSGRPLVILKTAATLDGRTATASGASQWITNAACREQVHRLRDRVDAILVGVGTVLRDDPRLTCRAPAGRDPLRLVLDSRLRIPDSAALLSLDSPAPTLIATTALACPARRAALAGRSGVELLELPADASGGVSLPALLDELGRRGLLSLLVEGGARVNQAFLQQRLIDRLMLYLGAKLLGGGDGKGLFDGPGPLDLADALPVRDIRLRRFGDDLLLEGELACSPD
ncbi:diaminohydroxyphosphoribosylaminopyrimidine deaminase [Desulfuromonas thiophila]|uniref:Riboflavin biosynthesis protein RibD n=2 Tax=Desulfuromonas thiophila TaxID=57664 RepID=A0A1G7AJ46_9BACT|nr:bifunctional diaminohydroxyphosphoribosylaminopyrimidine deaminase/5-amino-6-(5-phosphoribosylamino)uracil reductase RibD [Desulfuromonas thiophila]SDE14750.1 diaminohydroxyphosphoribosylaminopyrimidine deaminase [Desulfuromonas thiophila]